MAIICREDAERPSKDQASVAVILTSEPTGNPAALIRWKYISAFPLSSYQDTAYSEPDQAIEQSSELPESGSTLTSPPIWLPYSSSRMKYISDLPEVT